MPDDTEKDGREADETDSDDIVIDDTDTGSNEADTAELEKLKADLDKAKSEYLYLMADFDNYRKNAIKERSELMRFGSERLIRELLNVVDNFERALENVSNTEKFQEGVQMISQELKTLLNKFGVNEIPAQGLPFDPSAHEALSSEPTAEVAPNHVARVFKKAYKLHDKLIRPAQVTVAVAPTAPEENENKDKEKNTGA